MRTLFVSTLVLALAVAGPALAKNKKGGGDGGTHVINDAGAKTTVTCTADMPEVAINGASGEITIEGPCTKIAVNGAGNKIVIAQVEKLAINGSKNQVKVAAAGKIAVTGTENTVTYKAGLGGAKKPKVAVLGKGNSVKQE